tara:strand:+ start:87432 stop:93629 length:6198 start_codon:yes stop_codon:yes gene_type:complete
MLTNNTELQIGPLKYTHVVQKIALQERKAVDVLATARSNRNFIVDSGESQHRAQIRLLFTGLDEINGGVGETEGTSGLRGLIALFKTSPVISIRNKYLTSSWKNQDDLVLDSETSSVLGPDSTFYPDIVPVALEGIELENVPDIPFSIQVTLSVSRVDVGPVSDAQTLKYLSETSRFAEGTTEPSGAFWLRKWLDQLLSSGTIPELSREDFDKADFSWYGKTAVGSPIETNRENFHLHLSTSDVDNGGIVVSENCSVRHKFAYNKLISDIFSFPSHMGTSARSMSLDIVFNNQKNDYMYQKFCRFKETSDEIIRSKNRYDRVTGWHVKTPISKLLGVKKSTENVQPGERPWEGVYVPINVSSENGDEPNMINCRIDMLENNVDFYSENEVVLTNGGTDYADLRKYFDKVLEQEYAFRLKLRENTDDALKEITGKSTEDNYKGFQLFWPIEKGITNLKPSAPFSILNKDTLRAVFLDTKFDENNAVKDALLAHPLATGEVIANRRVRVSDKIASTATIVKNTLAGLSQDDPPTARLIKAIQDQVKEKFLHHNFGGNSTWWRTPRVEGAGGIEITPEMRRQRREDELGDLSLDIALRLTEGFLGDLSSGFTSTSSTGKIISRIFASDFGFISHFEDALFRVITERKGKHKSLPFAYSTDGVYSAFFKLIAAYTLERDSTITTSEARKEYLDNNRNLQASSLYPDLILPTYFELYGDRWEEFAPSIDDLGVETYNESEQQNRDTVPAVQLNDVVSPAAWFFIRRVKTGEAGLKPLARTTADVINSIGADMSISMPFNTKDIEDIEELLTPNYVENGMKGSKTGKTLPEIIEGALRTHRAINASEYREDLTTILSNAEKFEEGFISGNGNIKVYIHHNGNLGLPREVNVPGLGAEIYRVVKNRKEFNGDETRRLDADAAYATSLDTGVKFRRHEDANTKKLMDSSLDQIADDQYSAERMFPSIKVYLVDRRGNDIIADDALFALNAIVSVDVTLDKNDAPLAVLKIADPLYTLQSDYFSKTNIAYKDNEGNFLPDNEKKILSSLRGADQESSLKRYKLAQGRSIQIRMGYSAMAYNLPIVFTGRITEIVPGDQLTVVAQGWKAELINRKVSFTNSEPKNWGARDLAIQAITYANPDGFGDYFPEYDAKFILRHLGNKDVATAVQNSIDNGQNVDLNEVGTRGIRGGISNFIVTSFGFSSLDKSHKGFDTRLKNIWYPDTSLYNNALGLRSTFGFMPSFINDSWIIPLQSSWDVLKEASRHAWNCIVDVVPYDNEATIFMGHPDQPYYYTRGDNLSKGLYSKYKKTKTQQIDKTLAELMEGFLASDYFLSSSISLELRDLQITIDGVHKPKKGSDDWWNSGDEDLWVSGRVSQDSAFAKHNVSFTLFEGLKGYAWLYGKWSKSPNAKVSSLLGTGLTTNGRILKELSTSGLPAAQLNALKSSGFYSHPATYLFSKFFGVPMGDMMRSWPRAENDLEELLSRSGRYQDLTEAVKTRMIGLGKNSYYHKDLIIQLTTESKLPQNFVTGGFQPGGAAKSYTPLIYLRSIRNQVANLNDEALNRTIDGYIAFYELNPDLTPQAVNRSNKRITRNELDRVENLRKDMLINVLAEVTRASANLEKNRGSVLGALGIPVSTPLALLIEQNLELFKAFIYYFCLYVLEDDDARQLAANVTDPVGDLLPPNMKVFRVHHFADDDHNIIKNNITATTREMWNTVVVEHPSLGSAEDSTVESEDQLYTQGRINSGVNWVYYPKQEVSGVIGLQFHPGLTLSNKKIKVFTELNCQSPELAAKLACGHLADGIKKMYRGNLLLLGKNIKPWDRIVLGDKYTKMTGVVEVESVIHHWNVDQGWITNIIPNAVCDANPGAGILHTAAMEATFQAVFNTLDFVSDALMVATIVATLGAATPLAAGHFGIKKGVTGLAKRFLEKGLRGGSKATLKLYAEGGRKLASAGKAAGADLLKRGETLNALRGVFKSYSGPALAVLKNELLVATGEFTAHMLFKSTVIPAFMESAKDVDQLPVILSPIIYNGNPYTAGLETEDAIWAMSAFGFYYSYRQIQQGAALLWDELNN